MYILILTILSCSLPLVSTAQQKKVSDLPVITVQAGTVMINGKTKVALEHRALMEMDNKENKPSYYIMYAPVNGNSTVFTTEKNDKYFVVEGKNSDGSTTPVQADYVIFLKRNINNPLIISQ
jgi:hypothetical protein